MHPRSEHAGPLLGPNARPPVDIPRLAGPLALPGARASLGQVDRPPLLVRLGVIGAETEALGRVSPSLGYETECRHVNPNRGGQRRGNADIFGQQPNAKPVP